MKALFLACLFLVLAGHALPAAAGCNERVLVSGFQSNNVHVYSACDGSFERLLDGQGRIRGPQAVRVGPNGMIHVVSESNGRILRYDAQTLDFVDTFITTGAGFSPTGIAFGPDGDVYVCGYAGDSVRRYDGTTGSLEATVVPAGGGGLSGADNGMTFGPDGRLYIPSYDNNAVVVYDPSTGSATNFIASSAGGLNRTRGIIFESGGTVLVSSEGSGQILRFGAGGSFLGVFSTGLGAPAGFNRLADGRYVVATNGTSVELVNADGTRAGLLYPGASGGVEGATYAAVVASASSVDPTQVGSQYWIVGVGSMPSGRVLELDMVSATGAAFGSAFDPQAVVRKRWGRVRIEFASCTAATLTWISTGTDSAGFGNYGYPLSLLIPTALTTQCQATPFDQVTSTDFVNGTWWGGAARDGEGWLISKAPDGTVFVAFFTHRPPT